MCVAVPMKVIAIAGDRATAALGDLERTISLALLPETAVGDYVIVHAGFAIERLNETEAEQTLQLLSSLEDFAPLAPKGQ